MSHETLATISVNRNPNGITIASNALRELNKLEKTTNETAGRINRIVRNSVNTLYNLVQLTGQTVDATLMMIFNAVSLAAEAITAIANAEAMTGYGMVKAGVTFMVAAALWVQAWNIKEQAGIMNMQLMAVQNIVNMWG